MGQVFVSYTHDSPQHKDRVLALVDRLRAEGVDCLFDQFVMSPPEGWPLWMSDQVDVSEFVLVVVSETYAKRFKGKEVKGKGKGAKWEGAIITQELYDSEGENNKFVPVVLSAQDTEWIPTVLRGVTYYDVSVAYGYESLYRRLTHQPEILKRPLGQLRTLPVKQRLTEFTAIESVWPNRKKAKVAYSDEDEQHDTHLLRFYSQCLDRPAFQDSSRREGSWGAFDKAVEDTITAINTGTLKGRDGTILGKGSGKSFLRHSDWRTRMDGIVDLLRAIRSRFHEAQQAGTVKSVDGELHIGNDPALTDWTDRTRRRVIKEFNSLCDEAGIPSLHFT